MKKSLVLLCCAVPVFAAAVFAAVNYQPLKKVSVPGAGGWDYVTVDAAARRVYVSHSTQVDVLDADSFAIVGTIPNTPVSTALPSPVMPGADISQRERPTQ